VTSTLRPWPRARPRVEHARDVAGIVLPVAIDRGDPRSGRKPNTSQDGSALSVLRRVAYHTQSRLIRSQFPQHGHGIVSAAVIDDNDVEQFSMVSHRHVDLGDQFAKRAPESDPPRRAVLTPRVDRRLSVLA
jgi:hypothetical protein